ncbi:MFS transporter [Listeria costaricensis]|uniref:MFS transporter n=1 Tax=Listeria costaricensis TaxID=2026604 RepID=UPI000C0842FB|nr:MFS transporter [Listeria costaricensis]
MNKELKSKISIFSLTMLSMSALAIAPSFGMIAGAFPDAGMASIQMLTAIPSLTSLIAAFAVGKLAGQLSLKKLALFGPLLIFLGGIAPFFVTGSLAFLLVCAGILGLGIGIITNITPLLITTLIPAEDRQAVMGQNTAFVSIGAIVMTMIGGNLAQQGWNYNYLVYILAGVILILATVLLPSVRGIKNGEAPKVAAGGEKLGMPIWVIALLGIAFLGLYNVFPNNVALFVEGNGLGDTANSAMANTIGLVGGLVSGLLLGKMIRFFQKYSFAVSFGLLGLSMWLLNVSPNIACVYVACFLIGFSLSIFMSQAPFAISISVSGMKMPIAIAVYSAGTAIGGFISPVLVNGLADLFLHEDAGSNIVIAGLIGVVICIVLVLSRFQEKLLQRSSFGIVMEEGVKIDE